jgi:uncharacterized repeat protein (TIGR03803 family)
VRPRRRTPLKQSPGPRKSSTSSSHSVHRIMSPGLPSKRLLILMTLLVVFSGHAFAGSKYQVIHRFQQSGSIGNTPIGLISDSAGNLYGTTNTGGKYGFGTVFELSPPGTAGGPWTTTLLYSFPTGSAVYQSAGAGSLILDQLGNLYGVSTWGGHGCSVFGCGYVFELTPPQEAGSGWTENTLYIFSGWDGYQPGGLALDQEGNVYGTTFGGGRGCMAVGCGTVFKLTPSTDGKAWKRTVLYFFKGVLGEQGNGDGAGPLGLILDPKGNLYGVTVNGGHCDQAGCYGTAFELKPPRNNSGGAWTESVLYRFGSGEQLTSGVVREDSGSLYGSTLDSVYQLRLANGVWTENILVSGAYLYGGVIFDRAGNLYGMTLNSSQYTHGTVFKLSPPGKGHSRWTQTVLHAFAGGRDGSAPSQGVTFGLGGELYGTTLRGGNNMCPVDGDAGCGTVFTVVP